MKIEIEYEASWRNSFLNGSNDEALPKKGRKFVGSSTALKKNENFIQREVTHNTVMGILNRLTGEQRKLYQTRKDVNYYFRDIENKVSFNDDINLASREIVYLRNMSGNTDQNSFTGAIKTDHEIFNSEYSILFWGVLELGLDALLEFIVDGIAIQNCNILDPLLISERFSQIGKLKSLAIEEKAKEALLVLEEKFVGTNYMNNKDEIVPLNLYCSALYLQLERLSVQFDMSSLLTKAGTIPGISKRLFTKKDFMNNFTTGGQKKVFGNPYIKKEKIKGLGEVISMLKKASGTLTIEIDIPREKAKELKKLIENAAVSSFYLGKKGLAYVTNISIKEVK